MFEHVHPLHSYSQLVAKIVADLLLLVDIDSDVDVHDFANLHVESYQDQ